MLAMLDYAIILVYLAGIITVGIVVGRKEKLADFLVNNRKTKLLLMVTSLVSTTVGAGVIFSTASGAYQSGMSIGLTLLLGSAPALFFTAYLAPRINDFGRKHNAHTISEFIGRRYSRSASFVAAFITFVAYFIYLAVQLVAVATLAHVAAGVAFTTALVVAAAITITYVAVAGIKSDFYTDFVQFWLMCILLLVLLIPIGFFKLGGFATLKALPPSYYDPFAFGGLAFFIGGLILGTTHYLVSMDIWQRIYAADGEKTAKRTFLWSAFLIIPFVVVPVILGMLASHAMPGIDPDSVIFVLMVEYLPTGALGLGVAGVLAVIMSTIDSMLLVGSTTLTKDLYKGYLQPKASEEQMLTAARWFTVLFGLCGLAVAYFYPDILQLGITGIFMLLTILPALLGAFFWKRSTAAAATWSMALGFVTLLATLPFLPKTAFIPSVLVGMATLVVLSYTTKHARGERTV